MQQYGIQIYDKEQPLIVSNPKAREIRARGGDDSPLLLVPELCTRTGEWSCGGRAGWLSVFPSEYAFGVCLKLFSQLKNIVSPVVV